MKALKLEVFESELTGAASVTVVLDSMHLEEVKLASYDTGYSAGWEDAMAAQSTDATRVQADLARNLQSLSFTYYEARLHILRGLEPLLNGVMAQVLPELAKETLAPIVLDVLMPLAEQMADAPVGLILNPVARPAIEALLEQATGLPISIIEEPSLGEGQVYLRLGDSEVEINLDRAIVEITAAVRGFFELSEG